MAFDNTKYDVELNTVPYRISGYQKSDFSPFLPRFSSGDTTESEFDLLKVATVKGFEGGQLQRFWDDEKSVFAIQGLFPIFDDGVLYPVDDVTTDSELIGSTKAKITAVLTTPTYTWIAYRTASANSVVRVDTAGNTQAITLPSQLSGVSGGTTDAGRIASIVQHGTQIWFAGFSGVALGYLSDTTDTSVSAVGSGSTPTLSKMVSFRGQLYGTDGKQGDEWGAKLFRHTGSTSSRARVEVGYIGARNYSPFHEILIYNNRIMLMRNDGMYAYDGVQLIPVEDARGHINDLNYRFPLVHKGFLYYWMPDGFYRFNGSLIEKLYDISETGYPVAGCAGRNRLWYAFSNSSAIASSRYNKASGYDFSSGDSVDGSLFCYDGKGFFEYARTPAWTQSSPDFTGQGELNFIFWFGEKIWLNSDTDKIGTGSGDVNRYYTVSTDELALSGTKSWRLITSVFDGEYPMIDKNVDNLELVLDGDVSADEDITLEYRTDGFDGSIGWTSLGTIKTQTRLQEYMFRTIAAGGVTFKRIQFRLTGTTTAGYGLAKFIIRYTLSPEVKWQWQFTALCFGDKTIEPLVLADKTAGTQAVSLLRGNIYDARISDQPVKFVDVDQLDLNGAHNNSTTTITLNSTNMLKDRGFVQIDDEVIYYSAKTSTTLTGCFRAMLGTSAASHSDNAKVFPTYRVVVRQISNEFIEMQDDGVDITEDKARPSRISLILQEV